MGKTESEPVPNVLKEAIEKVKSVAIAGFPLCLGVDLENTLMQPLNSNGRYPHLIPTENKTLSKFLRALIGELRQSGTQSSLFLANASSLEADPLAKCGLDHDVVANYLKTGYQHLRQFGELVVPIANLKFYHEANGVIVHFNDLQMYPSLIEHTPHNWNVYSATVLPYSGNHPPESLQRYASNILNTFSAVDVKQVLDLRTKGRAAELRFFREQAY
ncbi:MAG: hypothetical protein U0525_00430 [Patescibacteria group bacterium]